MQALGAFGKIVSKQQDQWYAQHIPTAAALLKELIEDAIISKVDHKHLNHDVDFLEGVIPTAENLATVFWGILESRIGEGKLYEIRVYESSKNIAFVRR